MSEGTPGRGPDADPRTDTDAGQGSTNGRPSPQPVRYGPRNGSGRSGATGLDSTNARTAPGASSSQQYRAPESPSSPANGRHAPSADTPTSNGAQGGAPNGAARGSAGANGTAANGRAGASPASYTRPRTDGGPTRPQPSEQERQVADARTAAAARNASVAKVNGGPVPAGSPAPAQDTVVPTEALATTAEAERPAGLLGRLRSRERDRVPQGAQVADAPTADTSATAVGAPSAGAADAEQQSEPAVSDPPAEERALTWRDRLGLPAKPVKPLPVDVPDSGPGVPTAAAAAAVASVAAGTTPPVTKASQTGPTSAPQAASQQGSVTPSSPVATTDTVVIPAVEAGTVDPASPAATASGQALVAAKPKVGVARRTRKARLRLSRVDPWSVMKTAFLFSIAAGIILVVATYGVWSVLNASGLFAAVDDMVKSVVSTPGDTTPFRIEEYVNTQKILGIAALIAVVDVLIFTALATLGSFLYNLAATVLGGLEVTLAED